MTRINALVALGALSALVLPQPALALDQDDRQSLSRHGEASVEAFAKFGDVGETLTHISSRKFGGTGSQRREMSRRLDVALEPWKNASQSAKNSLSYKVLPHAFTVADEGMSMLGAAIEGDYRGVMGTAVSVAVEPSATAAGASVIGAIGTGIGATVGSFIPVVGTAGGAMVGGAIGTVAGGYICSVAYDIYIKEWVGKGVEAGLAGLFDDTKLHEAMMARDQFLREQGADDLKAAWSQLRMVSKDFNPAGVELVGPGSTPYIVPPKPPLPDPQQQAALTTGNVLAGVRKFSIGPQMWDINGDVATHRMEYPGVTDTVLTARGTISVNRIEGTMTWVHRNDDGRCGYVVRETAPFTFVFGPEAVAGEIKPGPVEVLSTKGPCKTGWAKMTQGSSFTAPWHKVE